ncbi:MAG: rifampicin phosphotransferase [Gaiellales bacterium]|nr:rifampicin phosphotransferase [Gaiellales bacterium]
MIVELGEAAPDEVGGKALGLARLAELGLPVPPAVVVPVSARGRLDDPEAVADRLGEPLAVRSSAVGEDAADRSAAGQYESLMGVRKEQLRDAVARVHASGTGERARAYGADGGMAVVIQREVLSTRAGVAFSRDPVGGSDDVVIECAFGHGEAVVGGETTPDRYRVGADGRVSARVAAGALRTLRDDEARDVAELARRAERGFGSAVDVEFCFERRRLWLVQCRPITTL